MKKVIVLITLILAGAGFVFAGSEGDVMPPVWQNRANNDSGLPIKKGISLLLIREGNIIIHKGSKFNSETIINSKSKPNILSIGFSGKKYSLIATTICRKTMTTASTDKKRTFAISFTGNNLEFNVLI